VFSYICIFVLYYLKRSCQDQGEAQYRHFVISIIEKDSIGYGCEVKNTSDYIDREELLIKLKMCEFLKIKPLFIMRFSPKTYNWDIIRSGGYAMIFEKQIYPFGQEMLVDRIIEVLGMPVDFPHLWIKNFATSCRFFV